MNTTKTKSTKISKIKRRNNIHQRMKEPRQNKTRKESRRKTTKNNNPKNQRRQSQLNKQKLKKTMDGSKFQPKLKRDDLCVYEMFIFNSNKVTLVLLKNTISNMKKLTYFQTYNFVSYLYYHV